MVKEQSQNKCLNYSNAIALLMNHVRLINANVRKTISLVVPFVLVMKENVVTYRQSMKNTTRVSERNLKTPRTIKTKFKSMV